MPTIPFTRERAADYAADMIARFLGFTAETAGRITDFNVGSNIRSFFETIGLRFEHLDNKVAAALRRAIPTVLYEFFGDGDGLTTTVGFPALPALPATGLVRFTRVDGGTGDLLIPAGTRLTAPQTAAVAARTYVTTTAATLATGSALIDVRVACTQPGPIGSTPANTLALLDQVAGIASATNPAALRGTAAETDEQRRVRFAEYIRNLARAQAGGLEAGARTAQLVSGGVVLERVLTARAVPRAQKRGLVDVFVDSGGGSASGALVDEAQRVLDGGLAPDGTRRHGYKAAGVVVVVRSVSSQAVPVTAAIRVEPGYRFADVEPVVARAVEDALFSLGAGVTLVHADLICAIAQVPGVADLALATPTANVDAALGARILPGVVTITEAPLL